MRKGKVMRLVDERSGAMECKVCGSFHVAMINGETGFYYRGSWQCQNGCSLDELKEGKENK